MNMRWKRAFDGFFAGFNAVGAGRMLECNGLFVPYFERMLLERIKRKCIDCVLDTFGCVCLLSIAILLLYNWLVLELFE